ncbi:ATP-binding protein [Spirosoma aerophilum]
MEYINKLIHGMDTVAHLQHQLSLLERRLAREKSARLEAETILEKKSRQLFDADQQLRQLNNNLAHEISLQVDQLKQSESRYRELIDSVQDIIYKITPQGFFTFVNPIVEQYLGFTERELLGRHFLELVHPDDRDRLRAFYQDMIREQIPSSYQEFLVCTKDGRNLWIGQTVRWVDSEHSKTELVGVARDITERKRTEQELARAKRAAEEAQLTEKQFLANMSHEIRTPLNAIVGFSDLLQTTTLLPEQKDYITHVQTAGRNLLTIVNDILDISKIEAGMLQLEETPFNLMALIETIQTMLKPGVMDKQLQLAVTIDPHLPTYVIGDPTRFSQIVSNLLSNAVKFTHQGGVSLKIDQQNQDDETVWIRLTIEDTGIGIAPEALPHIFERFRQANEFTTRLYGGTGLGLPIVRSLTEMHGGQVTVTSEQGKGSCFTVTIPFRRAPAEMAPHQAATLANSPPQPRAYRLLIVEDNPVNQKLAQRVLQRLGYQSDLAENGQVALDRLKERDYDVILMDLQMPVMDGYTTTRHIRTVLGKTVPIIAMTAHAFASEREQCVQAGMNDFLTKPYRIEELQRVIQQHLPLGDLTALVAPHPPVDEPVRSGFNLPSFLSDVGQDRAFAQEFLALFLEQTPQEIDQLTAAGLQMDWVAMNSLLHRQKGVIGFLKLTDTVALQQELKQTLDQPKPGEAVSYELSRYIASLKADLTNIESALAQIQ